MDFYECLNVEMMVIAGLHTMNDSDELDKLLIGRA
jgi:hypothetical protein